MPGFADDKPIIIFDGKCVLCSRWARFVLRHDRRRRFRLLAAQTPLGAALYEHYGLDPISYETNILLEDGRAWLKSEGTIRMFERLGFALERARRRPRRAACAARPALQRRRAQSAAVVRQPRDLLPAGSRRRGSLRCDERSSRSDRRRLRRVRRADRRSCSKTSRG